MSAHLGLVPQFSGKLTIARIRSAKLIADRSSDLTYVHLMIITNQWETLAGKSAFEIWATTFGVKIKKYHADNEIFDEKPFR